MAEGKLEITDELLVAYVDDELDVTQRAMVSGAMDGDATLSRRADEMRLARDLLCEAFPLQPEAAVPARIDAAIKNLAAAGVRHSSRPRTALRYRYRTSRAIAAGLVLFAMAVAGYVALRDASESTGNNVAALTRIDPDNPLHHLLESTPSAELIEGEGAALRAVLTFQAKDGRFCREFEVFSDSESSTGIACREHGHWNTEVLLSAAAIPPNGPPDGPLNGNYYTPAGGFDVPAVAEVVERLIKGEPLNVQQEAHLLAAGWRTVAPEDP